MPLVGVVDVSPARPRSSWSAPSRANCGRGYYCASRRFQSISTPTARFSFSVKSRNPAVPLCQRHDGADCRRHRRRLHAAGAARLGGGHPHGRWPAHVGGCADPFPGPPGRHCGDQGALVLVPAPLPQRHGAPDGLSRANTAPCAFSMFSARAAWRAFSPCGRSRPRPDRARARCRHLLRFEHGRAAGRGGLRELGDGLRLGVQRVPMSRYPDYTDLKAQIAAVRIRSRLQPDVMHAHGERRALCAAAGAAAPAPPVCDGLHPPWRQLQLQTRLLRAQALHGCGAAARTGDGHVHVRERLHRGAVPRLCRPHAAQPINRIVKNGVSDAEFEPIDHSQAAFDLSILGELRSAKGVDTLIEALHLLRNDTR